MCLLTKTIARAFIMGLVFFLGGCTAETVITQAPYDIVVYGGTSGGVAAAVSTAYQQTDPGLELVWQAWFISMRDGYEW